MVDLGHHGDREVGPGLVDLAVNVRVPAPPGWLTEQVVASLSTLAAYPDPAPARSALAHRHGVDPAMVLPTAGAAEAFTLLARSGLARRALVVHPQFTEPEAALVRAGVPVERLVLRAEDGFRLPAATRRPGSVGDPDPGRLVVLGNPTNPTGVLHPRPDLERLQHRCGGVLVVDEAFLDEVVDGQRHSMIGPSMPGVLVVRSLTKTWGLAGLRAGYVVGDPALVGALAGQQPPWSVSTPAVAAMVALSGPRALTQERALAQELVGWREHLVVGLAALGVPVVAGTGPFVLAEPGPGVREALREQGYAVRRGDTFPGLGPSWVRIAVRAPAVSDGLLQALHRVRERGGC